MSNMTTMLFFSIGLLLLLTIVLLTYSLVLRWQTEQRKDLLAAKTMEWNEIVDNWLAAGEMGSVARQDAREFLEYIVTRCELQDIATSAELGKLVEKLGYDQIIRRNLKRRNVYNKAWAIHLAGVFYLTSFKNEIITCVDHQHHLVSFVACQSLATLLDPSDEFFNKMLFRLIGRYNKWTTEKLAEVIILMGPVAARKLLDFITYSEVQGNLLLFIIDLLGEMGLTEAGPELHKKLRQQVEGETNCETVVRIVRSLGLIGYSQALPDITRLLHHEKWFIRSQVAKTLGELKSEKMVMALSEAMSDDNWWVRHNAGEAMCKLGIVGIQRLEEISNTSNDRFAREMARMTLEKRGGIIHAMV